MDLGTQSRILEISNKATVKPFVVLGSPDPDSTELTALTVISGDPTFSGPLAGVPLGLPVYHVLEDEVAYLADPQVYEAQVGLMKVALDAEAICSTIRRIRNEAEAE
jgi:glycine/sarcosine/betaine reductase complex component A